MYTFLNQSRIEKNWEKYSKQRQKDELPLGEEARDFQVFFAVLCSLANARNAHHNEENGKNKVAAAATV